MALELAIKAWVVPVGVVGTHWGLDLGVHQVAGEAAAAAEKAAEFEGFAEADPVMWVIGWKVACKSNVEIDFVW